MSPLRRAEAEDRDKQSSGEDTLPEDADKEEMPPGASLGGEAEKRGMVVLCGHAAAMSPAPVSGTLTRRSEADNESDLPCLECCVCGKVALVGGAEYMDENYPRVGNDWWEVERCQCEQPAEQHV